MTNIEHLLENALSAVDKAEVNGTDAYEAFLTAMNYDYNKDMLAGVSMTCGELWEVVQYIKYTREMYPDEADMGKKSFPSDDVLKALECCAGFEADVCDKCPLYDKDKGCVATYIDGGLFKLALDALKRKDVEIDIFVSKMEAFEDDISELRAEIKWLKEIIREMMEDEI